MTPTQILSWPSFSDFYLTLEQKRATIMTERRLHDLTITTAGKEAACTALL